MREIAIVRRNGDRYTALVDDVDYDRVMTLRWCVVPMVHCGKVYAQASQGRRHSNIYLHRFLTNAPQGLQVDHVNGNGLDCRRENLRLCTVFENHWNRTKTKRNTSGYKGVARNREKWVAVIKKFGKSYHLGRFETPELAYDAYCKAAITLHGEFARLT